jgi:hypothetical protein
VRRRCWIANRSKPNLLPIRPTSDAWQPFFHWESVRLCSATAMTVRYLRTCSRSLSVSCSLNSSYFASTCFSHRATRSAGISKEPSGWRTHLLWRYCCQWDQRSCSIAASGSSNSWSRFLMSCWPTGARLKLDCLLPVCGNALPRPSVRTTCSASRRATCGERQPGGLG